MKRIPLRSDLRALSGYHSPQVDVPVRLNTNEAPYAPPVAWLEEVAAVARDLDWNRYPDRVAAELRKGIAALHGVSADQVLVANGSNEVLQSVLLAYSGVGRNVTMFSPTYQMHAQIARVVGATVVEGVRNADFTLDPREIERVVTESQPAVSFICSPNNPTGTVEPRENIEVMLAVAPGVVVVDEAYAQFSPWSALELVNDDTPLVVTRTFSKTWSMAAARLGYLIGPRWLVADMEAVLLPYHLDAFKQRAGLLALKFVGEMESRVRDIVAGRDVITAAFDRLPVTWWPSGANFVLFRPESMSGRAVWQGLLDRGVLVRDCSSWAGLGDCLRVTVGTVEENETFVTALKEVLA
ncbi:MAG: histidinol-phosphate transaminase [Actinobacteria bacterium]|nr:histidinol-phosphate transaminase [Actinomycetota bacterium]